MKTLFLHVPKFNGFYKPIGDIIWLTYMPVGLLAVADYVHRHGFEVEVVHLGVEWLENQQFMVEQLVQERPEIKALGLDLHWHQQAFDVIEACRRIKHYRPDIFIFLGGYTASFFHAEIIKDFKMIDAVVRGDGEVPALSLLDALQNNSDLAGVENLTWRNVGKTIVNNQTYVADYHTLSTLNYTNFSLLRRAQTYIDYMGVPFFYGKAFGKKQNQKMFTLGSPVMPVPLGRGCPFNCTWCGGSHGPQKRFISCRSGYVLPSVESVLASVQAGKSAGYGIMHSCTDPEPVHQEYFIDLWKQLRKRELEVDWMFECNRLPSERFMHEFARTFPGPNSCIALSPESGNEKVRKLNKGPAFTNAEFMEKMDQLQYHGISTQVFFSYGLPGEDVHILQDTMRMRKYLRQRYKNITGLPVLSIEMEPGAPWQIEPEKFGVVTERKTFRDFYQAQARSVYGPFTTFGYYIPDYFDQALDQEDPYLDFALRLQQIKCKKMCFLNPNPKKPGNPVLGRAFCTLTSNLLKLKPRNLSRPF